jgi:hypothetical protein
MLKPDIGRHMGQSEPSTSPAAVDALANAVTTEIRLLEDLIGIMRKQREAVAVDDLSGVDDSVFATHRILVTLGEARRQRRSLCRFLAGTEDLAMGLLEETLGDRMTDELGFARDGLRAVALTLSREVELNRQVLRGALSAGNDYVRALYGPPNPPATAGYNNIARRAVGDGSGSLLLNRQG